MCSHAFTRPVDEAEEEQAILDLADLCRVTPQCFPGNNPVHFEPKHLPLVKDERYHAYGIDNATTRFVMFLSQYIGKTRIYMISPDMRVQLLRFGKFPFAMFKGSAFECELHEKPTVGEAAVVLQDCISLAGRDMTKSAFSYRKHVMQNIVDTYAESNKTLSKDQLHLKLKYMTCLDVGELINSDIKRLMKTNDAVIYKSDNNKHSFQSCDNSLLYLNTVTMKTVVAMLKHEGAAVEDNSNNTTNNTPPASGWTAIFSRQTKHSREITDSDIKEWEDVVQRVTGDDS